MTSCVRGILGGSPGRKEINQVGAGKAGVHLFHFEQSR